MRRFRFLSGAWVFLALGLVAGRSQPAVFREEPELSLSHLEAATVFAWGGVGYSGKGISPGELAFREIWKRRNPELFRRVLAHGTPEGGCYALIGLRELAPKEFPAAMAAFLARPPFRLHHQTGCVTRIEDADFVLIAIDHGRYAIPAALKRPAFTDSHAPPSPAESR